MGYVVLPTRTSNDLNSAADINQLMENIEYVKASVENEIQIIEELNYATYSLYYVQSSAPSSPEHGCLWYDTDDNKLYKYNIKTTNWTEIDWRTAVQATPEWQNGKLRINNGKLETTRYGDTWIEVYPLCGANKIEVKNKEYLYYTFPAVDVDYGVWVNTSGHNTSAILWKGKLYTTSGNNSYHYNSTTGRGLNGQNPFYGIGNYKRVPIPTYSPIKKVGGFYNTYAYALLENGDLYTWGYNINGQCGAGHTNQIPTPTIVATNVLDVYSNPTQNSFDVALSRLFILKSDGLYATGYNGNGQLGVGDTTNRSSFTKCTVFTSSSQIKKVFPFGCNAGFNFVLTTDGKIYFCGHNKNGVCGDGTTANKTSFVDVTQQWAGVSSGVIDIDVVAGGSNYAATIAYYVTWAVMLITLSSSKIFKACGFNANGQLGDGTTTQRTSPVTVLNVPADNVIKLRANGSNGSSVHALCSNGNLWGWGYNAFGTVGDGTTTDRTTPTIVATNVKDIFLNGQSSHINNHYYQTFIAKEDGVYGCGNNSGYLGIGHTSTPVTSFTKVLLQLENGEYVTTMGCYTTENEGYAIIAITNKQKLYAWGYNGRNGITADSTINCLVPIQFRIQEG